MVYRPQTWRIRKWDLNVVPDVVKTKFENLKPLMYEGQTRAQGEICQFEIAIRNLLSDEGIIGVDRVRYLNFGRALYRARGHQTGLSLQKLAAAEKSKFVNIGLDAAILDRISQIVIGALPYT